MRCTLAENKGSLALFTATAMSVLGVVAIYGSGSLVSALATRKYQTQVKAVTGNQNLASLVIANKLIDSKALYFDSLTNSWKPKSYALDTSKEPMWGGEFSDSGIQEFKVNLPNTRTLSDADRDSLYRDGHLPVLPLGSANVVRTKVAIGGVSDDLRLNLSQTSEMVDASGRVITSSIKALVPTEWTRISSVNAPQGRRMHLSVYTGDTGNVLTRHRFIIWGGEVSGGGVRTNTGAIFDAKTNTWQTMSTVNSPSARSWRHTDSGVWTGDTGNPLTANRFFVWGGAGSATGVGGLYDPATDSWQLTSQAPTGVNGGDNFQMVWTGNTGNPATAFRVIIGPRFQGSNDTIPLMYDPALNTWQMLPLMPAYRQHYSAVWTGNTGNVLTANRMIIWGGWTSIPHNSGASYDPVANTWTALSAVGAPSPRYWNGSVWTGNTGDANTANRMIVWAGIATTDGSVRYSDGGIYDPATNSWIPMTNLNAPVARWDFEMHWDGSRAFIRSGCGGGASSYFYDLALDRWDPVTTISTLKNFRYVMSAFTGSDYIFWGGECAPSNSNPFCNEGGVFAPRK